MYPFNPQTHRSLEPPAVTLQKQINAFLSGDGFAVAGASSNREKFGNQVLRWYQQHRRTVWPINPRASEIEGLSAFPDLESVPGEIHGVSIITPPKITESVVDEAIRLGVRHLWMQPGAESIEAVERAEQAGINVISGTACILQVSDGSG